MTSERHELLSKVAYYYYVKDNSQATIAKELNVHRTTVSRLLKEAREKGVVNIQIKGFNKALFDLEQMAKKVYDLKYLEIVPSAHENSENDFRRLIGRKAAKLMHRIIKDDDNIGVSWGSSLATTVKYVEKKDTENTIFFPLVGGSTDINPSDHINTLVYKLSDKFNGNSLFINASAIQETPEVATGIIDSKYFLELKSCWENLDKAIVGIGGELGVEDSSWRYLLDKHDYETVKQNNIIGDCCCQFFDEKGVILKGDLNDRTIGIGLERLQEVPTSIGIAYGNDKVKAIRAVLENGYINSLVTDEKTLRSVLQD